MKIDSKTKDILLELHQYSVDLVCSYEHALQNITAQNLQANLTEFKLDHHNHLREIEVIFDRCNIEVPMRTKDLKGHFYEAETRIRSMLGDRQILKVLKSLEDHCIKCLQRATSELGNKGPPVSTITEKALDEVCEHILFYQNQLESNFDNQNTNMPHNSRKVS